MTQGVHEGDGAGLGGLNQVSWLEFWVGPTRVV